MACELSRRDGGWEGNSFLDAALVIDGLAEGDDGFISQHGQLTNCASYFDCLYDRFQSLFYIYVRRSVKVGVGCGVIRESIFNYRKCVTLLTICEDNQSMTNVLLATSPATYTC